VNGVWLPTVAWLGAMGVVALVAALAGGAAWGFGMLCAGLAILLVRHVSSLHALLMWLRDPQDSTVPSGSGPWETAFNALYRMQRSTSQRQHRLTGQLARFRSAAQAMPDGVVVLDADERIAWCNASAERYLGIDQRKDTGQPLLNLVRAPAFVDYVRGGDYSEPLIVRLTRDDELTLSIRFVPYGQEEKLLLARDVTQAEKLDTMRRDFVANVSHELKTPLTVVSGFTETIMDGNVDIATPRGRQVLDLMSAQTRRMLDLIDDLLTLSALESGSVPADEALIDVPTLLRSVHDDAVALSAGRHAISLRIDDPALINGSEKELRSAFANLVSNAIRYTPKGGRIELAWTRRDDGAGAFTVEDSGIGIEAAHIPRITERFYRVDTSRSRDTGGTGLGLAIVKHVLTRHQGALEVKSEVGRGSRFTAVLPARRVRIAPARSLEAIQ
jgi:two-component system phosphate regulon sensor histidine kinase PhoR